MKTHHVSASISCKYEFKQGKRSKHPKIRINIRGLGDAGFFDMDEDRRLIVVNSLSAGLVLRKRNYVDFPGHHPIKTFSFSSSGDSGQITFNAPDLCFPEEEFDNVPLEVEAINDEEIVFEAITPDDVQAKLQAKEAEAKELEDAYKERLERGNSVGQLPEIDRSVLEALEREANNDTVSALIPRMREAMRHENIPVITIRI